MAPWVSRGGMVPAWGKEGTLSQCKGPAHTHQPLSSFPRLPWLRQRLLPQLYGLLPHLGEHPLAHADALGCRASLLPGCEAGLAAVGTAEGAGTAGARGCRDAVAGLSKLLGYFQLKKPNAVKRERGKVPGGHLHMWPLHVLLPRSVLSLTSTGTGWGAASPQGSTSKGCPLEGSQQGHSPAGHGAGVGNMYWELGSPRTDWPHVPPTPGHLQEVPDPLPTSGAGGEHHRHPQRHHCQH